MTAKIIDGRDIARWIRAERAPQVERLRLKTGVTPGLLVALGGDNPASKVYAATSYGLASRSKSNLSA